jgi:NodT family efflux transporter outer membrane factor (OMF) lipoprotein
MCTSRSLRWTAAIAAAALAATACSGCTSLREYIDNGFKVGPNYCKPVAPVAANWIDYQDSRVNAEPADLRQWWTTFNDPVLASLIYTAYSQNLTLRQAGLRVLEAEAIRDVTVGNLFPQRQQAFGVYDRIGTSRNVALPTIPRFFSDWQLGADLGWELDFWGRFRRAIEAADAELDSSIENYDDVLVILLAEVASTYVELRTIEQRIVYARQNTEIQRSSLDLADQRFAAGATSKLDVTQARSNLAETEALIPELEAQRRQANNRLCVLLGIPPEDLQSMIGQSAIPTAPPDVVVGIPADLLRRRPDVRRAEREVAAQSARIGIAESDLYPQFVINGTLFLNADDFQRMFDSGAWAGSIGPSFRWNVLNYGRIVNNIRVEDARFRQLAVEYENTVLQANEEAENALVGFLRAQEQYRSLAESVAAAKESVELIRSLYREGKADYGRVFFAEFFLTIQQDDLAVVEGDIAQNLIQLYKALGGGWELRLQPQTAPSFVLTEQLEESNAEPVQLPVPPTPETE